MRHIYSDAHAAANVAATPGRHCKLMHDYGWRFAACPALCRCFSTKFTRRTLCTHGSMTRACNAPMHGSSGALPLLLHEIHLRHALRPRQSDARVQCAYARLVRRSAAVSPRNSHRTLCAHGSMTCACKAPMHGSSGALPLTPCGPCAGQIIYTQLEHARLIP